MYTFGILLCICGVALCRPNESLVVSSTTEPPKETTTIGNTQIQNQDDADTAPKVPKIYEMRVDTNVSNRFATTLVTSKVKNLAKTAQEATFSVVLPETAYISKFVMVINDKSYEAYVKEKEEAKQIYDQAVQSGQAAAHVEANARDSNRFTVSVNVEPQSKATFKLTYEELLQRRNEKYEIVLNIHPGQPVKDLIVEVNIAETRPLKFVKAPPLRSGNEINKNDGAEPQDPQAEIINVNSTSAVVKFTPNIEKQKQLAKGLGTKEENGLAGQFIVQYDVERDSEGGEILVKDGYFVHFFAPSELKPLPKHVVFVLDTSGSMDGIRIQQLKEAMNSILAELKPEDIFNIVEFSSTVKVWNVEEGKVKYEAGSDPWGYYPNPNSDATTTAKPTEKDLPTATKASEDNLKKAKDVVGQLNAFGGTDIKSALEVGLQLVKKNKQDKNDTHQPLIVFLTDGEPTVGETNTDKIISSVHEFNSGSIRSPIFSLSFGDGADREFLQKISLRNLGFARHIYEAADASLQLEEFYRQISSPLLSNVTFKYVSNVTQLTKTVFPIFFHGSELCVAGYAPVDPSNTDFVSDVTGRGILGPIKLIPKVVENPLGALERLWAYLTVKQILEARDAADNKTRYTQKALDLALKYSFVTPVTSLVVVKPNETSAVSTEDASKSGSPNFGGFHLQSQFAAVPGLPLPSPPQDVQPQYPQTSSFNAADLVIAARPAVISATYKPQSFTTPYHTSTRPGTTITSTTTSSPSVSSSSISSSTISSSTTTSSTTDSSDEYEALRKILPWLNNILGQNGILTSPPGGPPPPASINGIVTYVSGPAQTRNMSFKLNDVDHFIGVQQPRRNDRIVENGTLTILPGGDYELAIKGESQCQNSTIINEPPASVKLHHIPGKVIKNQSATLICTVEDHLPKSQPKNVTYIWYKGQYRISDVTSSNLTIQRASLETRGNYTCVAQNELGQSSPATIFVDVLAPPALIEAPPPYKGVLYSTRDVSLTCRFECYPICSVEWFKNGDPILIDKNDNTKSLYTVNERVHLADYNRNYFESIESTLIWNMTNWPNQVLDPSEQLSVYTCSSRSKAGAQIGTEKDASTEIAVDFPPRNITVSHTIVNVVENQFPIAVKCRGNGKPNPNYVWKRSFQLGFKSPPISHQSILQLGPMSRKEAGVYVCEVSNKYGRRDAKVHFNVLYAPECGIVFTQRRGKLALKCTAQGNPQTLDYTWKIVRSPGTINTKNVISTPTDSYLILDPTVRADRYYQCTANNSVGMGVPCERYVPASRHLEPKTPNSKPEISQLDSSENAHTVDTAGPGGHFEPTPSVPENTYDIESVQPVGPFEPSPGPPKNTQTTDRVRPADHFEPNPGPPGFSENTYEADRVRPGGHFEPNPGLPGPSENTYETDRVRPGGQFEPYPGTPGYYIPDYSQQEHPFWSSTTSKPRPGGIFGHLLPTSRPHFQRPGGFNINIQLPILNRGQPRNNGGLFSGGIGFL